MDGIQVFAADHRKNVKWNLPYIRLGNFQSDATINIKHDDEIAPYQQLLSEGAQLWWLSKHINEIGNPEFIALMHYSRFFTVVKSQEASIINCPEDIFQPSYAMQPNVLYAMMKKGRENGIDVMTILPNIPTQNGAAAKDTIEQLKQDIKNWNIVISDKMIDDAFNLFFSNCKDNIIKAGMTVALNAKAHYNCNLMCLRPQLLHQYIDMIIPTFKALKDMYDDQLKDMSPRAFSYILERFTSLYLYGLRAYGKTVGSIPIMVVKKKEIFDQYIYKR